MSRSHRDTTPISIRFEPEIAARLKAEAEARDLSASWLANKAVARFLDELIPVEEFTLTRPRDESLIVEQLCGVCGHHAHGAVMCDHISDGRWCGCVNMSQ